MEVGLAAIDEGERIAFAVVFREIQLLETRRLVIVVAHQRHGCPHCRGAGAKGPSASLPGD